MTNSVKQTILYLSSKLYFEGKKTGRWEIKLRTKIQELRKERKVTQSELADALGVTRQTIISLENGRYNASLILAHRIAEFFGASIEEIFIFDEEEMK